MDLLCWFCRFRLRLSGCNGCWLLPVGSFADPPPTGPPLTIFVLISQSSASQDGLETHSVAEADLALVMLLPPRPKCRDDRRAPRHSALNPLLTAFPGPLPALQPGCLWPVVSAHCASHSFSDSPSGPTAPWVPKATHLPPILSSPWAGPLVPVCHLLGPPIACLCPRLSLFPI